MHNHPNGMTWFSAQDDANEPNLAQIAVNRNGEGTKILSLLLTADDQWAGRVWLLPKIGAHAPLRLIRVTGNPIALHYEGCGAAAGMPAFQRQALAFGKALNDDLARLRVGVVGKGLRKWAYFRCPADPAEIVQLALMPDRRPSWRVAPDLLCRPTIDPSIRQLDGSFAHFWIRNGRIDWCADSG